MGTVCSFEKAGIRPKHYKGQQPWRQLPQILRFLSTLYGTKFSHNKENYLYEQKYFLDHEMINKQKQINI